jgi:hypothetical protein
MADKPTRASEYTSEQLELVRSTCLYVATRLRDLMDAKEALQVLRDDFLDHDGIGPRRVASFLRGGPDDEIQADVVGFIAALLDAVLGR